MVLEKFNLTGKTALITGGAGLLGVQHAEALLESGAKIVLTDTSESALQNARNKLMHTHKGSNVQIMLMNVTQLDVINEVEAKIRDEGGRIDILINNAAIDPKVENKSVVMNASRLEHFPLDQWNMQVAVGLTGAFLCCQVFGSAMAKDKKGGVILNIASDLSIFAPDQRIYRNDELPDELQPVKPVTYSVIKTGLIGLTRYIATYWANDGVRCNALSPGGVYTNQPEAFVKRLTSLIPLNRMAREDEYKAAVQFLCSEASSYMTGQNIIIDGGRSTW
jgi:NAD(P)-dependent dehydrogenase (short-subunit alcohol dehydrogenase family)